MFASVIFGGNLVVALGGLGWVLSQYGAPAGEILRRGVSPLLLVGFILTMVAAVLTFAGRWGRLLRTLGVGVRGARLVGYRMAGQSLSQLVPSGRLGGDPLRAWLLMQDRVGAAPAIASVAVDRTLEWGASMVFACVFASILVQRGVPGLEGAFVTVVSSTVALAVGLWVTGRRLESGAGLVSAVVRSTGLDRLGIVRGSLEVLAEAEADAATLVRGRRGMAAAFGLGLAANALVLLEVHLLLAAFGLPAGPVAVAGALFATGAAHSVPVPGAIGTLEAAQMWVFSLLGYSPATGLAVGLALRLRELCWIVPGLVVVLVRGLNPGAALVAAPEGTR